MNDFKLNNDDYEFIKLRAKLKGIKFCNNCNNNKISEKIYNIVKFILNYKK